MQTSLIASGHRHARRVIGEGVGILVLGCETRRGRVMLEDKVRRSCGHVGRRFHRWREPGSP